MRNYKSGNKAGRGTEQEAGRGIGKWHSIFIRIKSGSWTSCRHTEHITSPDNSSSQRTAHKRDAETNRGAKESSSKVCPGMRMSLLLNSKKSPLQCTTLQVWYYNYGPFRSTSPLSPPLIRRNPRIGTNQDDDMQSEQHDYYLRSVFVLAPTCRLLFSTSLSLPVSAVPWNLTGLPRAAILVNIRTPPLYIFYYTWCSDLAQWDRGRKD